MSYKGFTALRSCVAAVTLICATVASSQPSPSPPQAAPVIVQPGAPGTSNKTLSAAAATADTAPRPPSKADVDFMQGMIMHHSQAVEMTELLKTRSTDPAMIELGHKIDVSQSDEIRWMKHGSPTAACPRPWTRWPAWTCRTAI